MPARSAAVAAIVTAIAAIAVLDFWTSAEIIVSILFSVPLTMCVMQTSRRFIWGTTLAMIGLTIAAELWGFERAPLVHLGAGMANRVLLIAILVLLAALVDRRVKRELGLARDAGEVRAEAAALVAQNTQLESLMRAAAEELQNRELAAQHLVHMEARYRGLLEAAPDAMVVVDERGDIVLLNMLAKRQFGYDRGELIGRPVTEIIPEGFAERLIADGTRTAAEALEQHIGTGLELSGLRRDGTRFPIEIMLSPLTSADGILVTAAIRNISVRKEAERHLARMEGRYRGMLEAAPDAMVLVNDQRQIVLVNRQAELQFGYPRDELTTQPVDVIIPGGLAVPSGDGAAHAVIAATGRDRQGKTFPLELMVAPIDSAEGPLLTIAIRDITTRKAAEALLLLTLAELKRSNEELGQFAYIASHDLQEPLRMVASYTQLIAKRYKGRLDADADEFIAFAVDGAARMQRLIQDLLSYSRVGTTGVELTATSSEHALARALDNLQVAITESHAVVTHDPLPTVLADERQLSQLFQNLVGNAIKYQPPGTPRVHISSHKQGARWTFSVGDNGLGIEPKYFDRIFGMFQRLHKREEFAGTGIGLAICKKIVERHGGTLSVESELGHGSTFKFGLSESEISA